MEMIYNHGHNILSFSEQVNRSVITSNKHGIYGYFTSSRTTQDSGSWEIKQNYSLVPSLSLKVTILLILAKNC